MSNEIKKINLPEDWVVVILGFIILFGALSGIVLPAPSFNWGNGEELISKVFSEKNLIKVLWQFILVFVLGGLATFLTGKNIKSFLLGFPLVYLLTLLALLITGNIQVKGLGLEAVIFSLVFGLLIGNLIELPIWLRESLSTEVFVKIGLIILGSSVIFSDILKAGSLGLVQALVVVLSVWYFSYWVCQKLKIDKELTMMLSSAVSICGVSAAIATSGAIKGDAKKLSYVISLVLVVAIPMMLLMPIAARYLGLSEEVTGAWLGGTIDTSGAVVASGTLVGETALKISTIVKFAQNVLLGFAAFFISIYWSYKGNLSEEQKEVKPSLGVIWERFPKFVLGFIGASILFSFVLAPETVEPIKASLKSIQGLWFALAFTSIGLETKFADLIHADNRKPLFAFLIAQSFNIIVTLIIAYILFR